MQMGLLVGQVVFGGLSEDVSDSKNFIIDSGVYYLCSGAWIVIQRVIGKSLCSKLSHYCMISANLQYSESPQKMVGRCVQKKSTSITMNRIHLFEFTDLSWYPDLFRRFQTDYLQLVASLGSGHKYLIPLFKLARQNAHTNEIVDLCSGGTGPWVHLVEQLEQAELPVDVTLTDKYPNLAFVQRLAANPQQRINYFAESVDAMNVPDSLKGMRTLFKGFHHIRPNQAKVILQDAVNKKTAIGIFEASLRPPLGIILLLLSPLITIASYFLMTPFITPRSFSRFFWIYLIPVVPIATSWDGVVSLLRTYSPKELKALIDACPPEDYTWEIGYAQTGTPFFSFTYLVGYPTEEW
jgi:hypothetical protein